MYNNTMKVKCLSCLSIITALLLSSCANNSLNENNKYGFTVGPGMQEDAQDMNSKYNLMDSSDGKQDPNINSVFWKTKF